MRSNVPLYELVKPASFDDALARLAREPGVWRPFAGGTDLMVLFEAGKLAHTRYVSLWGLPELRGIVATEGAVVLGSLTTYTEILAHPVLQAEFPLLGKAAADIGGVATQNRGTIGGNIANASPAADMPPALLVYDASLELRSARASRIVPYDSFHTGYKQMDLAPDEIIRAVHLPRRRSWREGYRKVGTRRAQAISKICFAGGLDMDDGVARDVRLAFGSVAPIVVRARAAEAAVRGQRLTPDIVDAAARALARDITPIDDIRSTAAYRLKVAENVLRAFLSA